MFFPNVRSLHFSLFSVTLSTLKQLFNQYILFRLLRKTDSEACPIKFNGSYFQVHIQLHGNCIIWEYNMAMKRQVENSLICSMLHNISKINFILSLGTTLWAPSELAESTSCAYQIIGWWQGKATHSLSQGRVIPLGLLSLAPSGSICFIFHRTSTKRYCKQPHSQ